MTSNPASDPHPYPDGYPCHLTADAHDWEPPPEREATALERIAEAAEGGMTDPFNVALSTALEQEIGRRVRGEALLKEMRRYGDAPVWQWHARIDEVLGE